MEANVVPIRDDEPEQQSFDGFPLVGKRFSLTQARELPANRDLHQEEMVNFHGTGRVKGRHERRDGKESGHEARYTMTWEIEALEVYLD